MMDATRYDHNAFSKFVLDWLTPVVFSSGNQLYTLRASGQYPEAVLFFPGAVSGDIFNEYFLVQNRYGVKNDYRLANINYGDVGLSVWHVDTRLNSSGTNFRYDNSYTEHKLLRLIQADGLDEIELGIRGFDAGDLSRRGWIFGPNTYPATTKYDDTPTGMTMFVENGQGASYQVRMVSGANPVLRLSSSSLNFGNVNICTYSDLILTVYNDGDSPLVISSISRSSGPTDFSHQTVSFPVTIASGSSQDITFRFDAYNTGPLTATFAINSNDPDSPQAQVTLNGTGFLPDITLNLQVERKVERAWILRRDYAQITVQVSKASAFNVDSYQLTRRESGSSSTPRIIQTFRESDFSAGRVVYIDKYLETGKNYVYSVQAIDCYGRVLSSSYHEMTNSGLLREMIIRTIDK